MYSNKLNCLELLYGTSYLERPILSDMSTVKYKAFDNIESSHISDIFIQYELFSLIRAQYILTNKCEYQGHVYVLLLG